MLCWILTACAPGPEPVGDADPPHGSPTSDGTDAVPHTGDTGDTLPACADARLPSEVPQSVAGSTAEAGSWGEGDLPSGSCHDAGPEADTPEYAWAFAAPVGGRYVFDTDSDGDTAIFVLDGCGGEELGCNDNVGYPRHDATSRLVVALDEGQDVIVVVESRVETYQIAFDFVLNVSLQSDGELACDDNVDEDGDYAADCLDPDCAGFPSCAPACPDQVAGELPAAIVGTTLARPDESTSYCDGIAPYLYLPAGPSPDDSTAFVAPADGAYVFLLAEDLTFAPPPTVLSVWDGCGGAELGCVIRGTDPWGTPTTLGQGVVAELAAGESVVAVVDGLGGYAGPYELGIHACVDEALGAPPVSVSGSTIGQPNLLTGSCGGVFGLPAVAAPDRRFAFTAPNAARYRFSLTDQTDFAALLYVQASCGGAELACSQAPAGVGVDLDVDLGAGESVLVVVDGTGGAGAYELQVRAL